MYAACVESITNVKTYSPPLIQCHSAAAVRPTSITKSFAMQTKIHTHTAPSTICRRHRRLRLLSMIKALSTPSSSSDIVITFTRRRGGSPPPRLPARRAVAGQRRTGCKSIRALRPACSRPLSAELLFGTGQHTDHLNACAYYMIVASRKLLKDGLRVKSNAISAPGALILQRATAFQNACLIALWSCQITDIQFPTPVRDDGYRL